MQKVIYLKDIIKETKKEYISYLKNIKDIKEWSYYRFYLWHLVRQKLGNEIREKWKKGETAYIKYGKKTN